MIDYKKAEQAKKLLEESKVPHILAYANSDERFSTSLNGKYLAIKDFITAVMWEAAEEVYSEGGCARAMLEVGKIANAVLERLSEVEDEE